MNRSGVIIGRLLYALLTLTLAFTVLAACGLGVALWFMARVPPVVLGLASPAGAELVGIGLGGPGGRATLAIVTLESVVVAAIVTFMLLRLLGGAMRGEVFVPANVRRLRVIAGACAAAAITRFVLPPFAPAPLAAWLAGRGWSYNLGDALAALAALVLAEVFREGLRLREDAEMTI